MSTFSEEDSQCLSLWQRAAFSASVGEGDGSDSSRDGGGGAASAGAIADSLRARLALLELEHCKAKSTGNSSLHLAQPMQHYLAQYGKVMDSKEAVDNLAGAVGALTEGKRRECSKWKTSLSLESVLKIPQIQAMMRSDRSGPGVEEQQGATSKSAVPSQWASGLQPADGGKKPAVANKSVAQFPYTAPASSSGTKKASANSNGQSLSAGFSSINSRPSSSGGCAVPPQKSHFHQFQQKRPQTGLRKEEEEEEEEEDDRGSLSRKRARQDHSYRKQWKKRAEEEEEEEEGREDRGVQGGKVGTFVTARDQYIINQQKKFGGRERDARESRQRDAMSTNSYGVSKRSLGTRRVPESRFVPPVKRDTLEGQGFASEVQSRVSYGQGGGGGGKLPPELEGDERLRNIEPRMVELILSEIMDHGAPVSWDDIAGLDFAKATIKEIVVWPMLRPDIFTGLRGPPKGILLFGPPGTGKTLIGKCIASQVQATFFSISASSLTSKWIGEGEKMVRALFTVARCNQPAVIFIDEIDSLLSQRSDTEHESSRRIKTEFLVQLDGATTSADDHLLVIGATNRPHEIDEAARRRLVKRLYIPLPDSAARRVIVAHLMRQQLFSLSEEELTAIASRSEGYSGADMANLCREAAYGPVRGAAESIQHISADEMRPVLFKDFDAAFRVVRPSVSEKDLSLFVEWNNQFGCGSK